MESDAARAVNGSPCRRTKKEASGSSAACWLRSCRYRFSSSARSWPTQLGNSPQIQMENYRRVTPADKKRAVALAGLGAPPEEAKVVSLDEARRGKSG